MKVHRSPASERNCFGALAAKKLSIMVQLELNYFKPTAQYSLWAGNGIKINISFAKAKKLIQTFSLEIKVDEEFRIIYK